MADENTTVTESLLKLCDLLKSHQLLADSEVETLLNDTTVLPEKVNKVETVLSKQLGHNDQPISVTLSYNSNKLLEEWVNKSPITLIRRELKKNYTVIGNQPDRDNGWLWGEEIYPLGRIHVVRVDSRENDAQHFSVEEVNKLATTTKWRILVLGAPGIGKTSFAWKLTTEWAKERVLEYFLAVFYININTNSRLADALDTLLGEMKDLQTKIQASRKVLFILDGWNERSGARWDLIVTSKFPQASIMITAQTAFLPWLSTMKWDHVYKVKGMLGHYRIAEKVKHCEILTDKEMKSLLNHPLVEDIIMKFLQQGKREKTVAKLVHEIIRGITQRYLLCYDKNVNSLKMELPDCFNNKSFKNLCKMAFHNMLGGCSIRVNAIEKQSVDTFGLADTLNTVTGSTLYTFNHKVIQSFLAAIFMSQLNKEALELNFDSHQFHLAWYFYGYLTSERQDTLNIKHYTISTLYYFLGANIFPNTVANGLVSTKIKFKDEKLVPSCLYCLGQLIAQSNMNWSLSFIRCEIDPKGVLLLQRSLQSAAENVSINKLVIQDVNMPSLALLELANRQLILEELFIQHSQPSPSFISFKRNDIFLSIISQHQENLQILSLVNISIGLDGAQQIANGLQPSMGRHICALKQITMKNNNLGPEGTEVLVRSLKACKLLNKLCISHNDVEDTGAYAIADYITHNKLLEVLTVLDNTLTVDGSRAIAEALKQNTSVIDVTLHRASTGSLKEPVPWIIRETNRRQDTKMCNE